MCFFSLLSLRYWVVRFRLNNISHWIERRICALSSYQSHQIQNVCICGYSQPYFLFAWFGWVSMHLKIRFAYDGLTSWRAHWILCLIAVAVVVAVSFFSRCIHRKSVHIYNNMYGKRTCNVWLLPNFMNNSTFRQYEGKRLYISLSISFTHQSDECAYRKGKIVSRL